MDRHDVSEEVTAEHVAQLHQADLKIEREYGCRGFTYWFDGDRKTAFCLIEAPNIDALKRMHNDAHGDVPHSIIEVEASIVESFLGRIEDPEKSQNTELNIINDPAFRIIMVIETSNYLDRIEANQFNVFTQKFHNSVSKTLKQFEGSIVKQDNTSYLVSFKSVTNGILCALKIQANIKYITPKFVKSYRNLKIGLASGIPVTNKNHIFEDAILLSTRMCEIVKNKIVISNEIKALYESENRHTYIDKKLIRTLNPKEERFLTELMNFIESIWQNSNFNITEFNKALGYSKSQIYRKLKNLTDKSPNTFIRDYRLDKALKLLHDQKGNISEIAFETGFNSLAYFSKCFKSRFGLLPSKYIQQHIY
jgi:AraC-like DNA-binding protein